MTQKFPKTVLRRWFAKGNQRFPEKWHCYFYCLHFRAKL